MTSTMQIFIRSFTSAQGPLCSQLHRQALTAGLASPV